MSTSIYIFSDQKLTTGARGFSVADNVTANALVKNTRHSVCFKMTALFQYFTIFRMPCFAFCQKESQPNKGLAKSASNVSTGVHLRNKPANVKDTPLMNNNQPMEEIMCADWCEPCVMRLNCKNISAASGVDVYNNILECRHGACLKSLALQPALAQVIAFCLKSTRPRPKPILTGVPRHPLKCFSMENT